MILLKLDRNDIMGPELKLAFVSMCTLVLCNLDSGLTTQDYSNIIYLQQLNLDQNT